ncbi:C6 zinc finger domain protein [Aspergillus steynii IBT 23096]|uniref:C6 zinc finger domain protein n=1 Tax=Aspergillus steynii IBT 23096 TaxID=1392250 RepID=A0A2I2G116_9EURO|nr:C6 zinc finger domain protein [Aspergillus steynii IBT 23096]PLB46558.1 C6 zinc finger domain protein [Aspergillus steynii IBT 23096]
MADTSSPEKSSGWRISKACQECRKRKIKCNGHEPCKTCQLRNTPCTYREVIRQRKKKHQYRQDAEAAEAYAPNTARQPSPDVPRPSGRRNPSVSYTFNNSVSATHMESPSCKVQLYYGSTSHFALMHEIYRDLVESKHAPQSEDPREVQEAGAGLDMFSFRRIFFGGPDGTNDSLKNQNSADVPVMFLPHEQAKAFLDRFLSSLYVMVPFQSRDTFKRQLWNLYNPSPDFRTDTWGHSMILMGLAMGSLGTEQYSWGDVLFERVKASCAMLDDVVNLQTYAHFQTEQGRPNSAFLHLGTAARKAISAGLHKEAPNEGDTAHSMEERRTTFWALFFYETWFCFHLGRPCSLHSRDVGIALPEEPFMLALVHLSKVIARSADEMYGRHHDSLLQMWKIARSISDDLRCYDANMRRALGFGLDKCAQPGVLGVQQTMLITLYYHTILLTFRPFLIFRGRWQGDAKIAPPRGTNGTSRRPTEVPAWLNDACNHALSAACRTIHFLYEASIVNDLVRELRYHGYFLGSASFVLIYDLLHGENLANTHLQWIHASLQCLSSARAGDPIKSTIGAIETTLKKIHPSFEWVAHPATKDQGLAIDPATNALRPPTSMPNQQGGIMYDGLGDPMAAGLPMLSDFQGNSLQDDIHPASVGSEELLDLTMSDMGWDFDFSTMDLEAFFSINPNMGAPVI